MEVKLSRAMYDLALLFSLALAACGLGDSPDILGLDVSHHQLPLDWRAAKAQGIRFTYIKATEGTDWIDPAYRGHQKGARAQGIVVGAYHFFTFCSDPGSQAAHFLSTLDLRPGDLVPAVDVEQGGNCDREMDPRTMRGDVGIFTDIVARAIGREPIVYTTQGFYWRNFRGGFGNSPLWIRNVVWSPIASGHWSIWQYGVWGINGAEGRVDRNVLRGGETEFARLRY